MRLAYQLAMENDLIQADCVEATEFPDLAAKYRVYAVPRTVINGAQAVEGSVPEIFLVETILKTLQPPA